MKNPQQRLLSWVSMLRSFGLLQSHSWNFWDQASSRISNNEVGFSPRVLADHLQKLFPWFPSMLWGKAATKKEYHPKIERNMILRFVHETVERSLSATWYIQAFLLFILFGCKVQRETVERRNLKSFRSLLLRCVGIKGVVVISFGWMIQRVTKCYWANTIRSERLWHGPTDVSDPLLSNLEGYNDFQFRQTLPLSQDILMSNHLQSEYLGSYNQIIDHYHPGNQYWEDEVIPYYVSGYTKATREIQNTICMFVIESLKREGRRILIHNSEGNWVVPSSNHMLRFCHKSFIMKSSSDTRKKIIRQIDFLLAETQFGYWRNTVLHSTIIPAKLISLQNKILQYNMSAVNVKHNNHHLELSDNSRSLSFRFASRQLPSVPSGRTITLILHQRYSGYSNSITAQEPYSGAWIMNDDLVEVFDEDKGNCK